MKDLTIIVPLKPFKPEHTELYDRSIKSILTADKTNDVSIIFIGPDSAIKQIENYDFGERETLNIINNNTKNLELQFQINKAVKDVKTEYFSVLEFDDRYTENWFENFDKYSKYYDASLYLPLIEVFDNEKSELGAIGYLNEPVWASSFSDEIGYIDNECLKSFFDFVVSGGVFRKDDFLAVGGLKTNIKVFFWYEFLLRLTHNNKKIFVIPKVGYEHFINVEDSLTSEYQKLDAAEIDFWFKSAQDKYVFKNDVKISYVAD